MVSTTSSSKIIPTGKALASIALSTALASIIAFPSMAFADAKSDLDAANEAASAASTQYDEAVAVQEELAAQIEAKTAELADLEENQLPAARANYGKAVREMYMGGDDTTAIISSVLCGQSLREVFMILNAFESISEWHADTLANLKNTKTEIESVKIQLESDKAAQDAAVEEASAKKQEALDAQSAARKAYQATLPQNVPTTRRAPTSTSFYDEASAKAFIVMKESGGNYNARNGRYIGAYQLTNTYLNGDYSPENQDRVANQYVMGRYGSWMNAANFWVSHGWY